MTVGRRQREGLFLANVSQEVPSSQDLDFGILIPRNDCPLKVL